MIQRVADNTSPKGDDGDKQRLLSYAGNLKLACWGRSKAPLLRFMEACHAHCEDVFRPTLKVYVQRHRTDQWQLASFRSLRQLSTISMDSQVRDGLLKDINSFHGPYTLQWYRNRGIPHRRGYLFWGEPGTGKTSLAMALASYFELPLYLIDPTSIDNAELWAMFDKLPQKCFVLIEDIDSAGISREHMRQEQPEYSWRPSISLSGLLNAIDGPVSQEGRILIMTSNNPEHLDKALIRPGRVDKVIYMGYCPRLTASSLFSRIMGDSDDAEGGAVEGALAKLADDFSQEIPLDKISPAEVQGFLLEHTNEPAEAIRLAAEWAAGVIAERGRSEKMEQEAQKASEERRAARVKTEDLVDAMGQMMLQNKKMVSAPSWLGAAGSKLKTVVRGK
ncbi:P-loop containing nucleoside triphosphate hydrolase protein [Aulographum hederae CBS 113979]|uniref:P-loop containing nucleoside triphosphate hydrolase protein n=1 Tax=Aulographum hederae CBS 113979 TaxID=1176131 RepID=A0A6G1H0N7_9PEZI|nr:P-loop containing nucleoside triphosphate hydrolase protein [Aulographum hederae CBS 113979]